KGFSPDNVFVLLGTGLRSSPFQPEAPFTVGAFSAPPSFVAIASDPFIRITTFKTPGQAVSVNLVHNPSFENADLAAETNNLSGWQTCDEVGSRGAFGTETTNPIFGVDLAPKTFGALFGVTQAQNQLLLVVATPEDNAGIPTPGAHQALLDQPDL